MCVSYGNTRQVCVSEKTERRREKRERESEKESEKKREGGIAVT